MDGFAFGFCPAVKGHLHRQPFHNQFFQYCPLTDSVLPYDKTYPQLSCEPVVTADAAETAAPVNTLFDIGAGQVLEVQIALQDKTAQALQACSIEALFRDAEGHVLDPRLSGAAELATTQVGLRALVLPKGASGDVLQAGGQTSIFLLAPPDAVSLEITGLCKSLSGTVQVQPLAVLWSGRAGKQMRENVKRLSTARTELLRRHLSPCEAELALLESDAAQILRQVDALIAYFTPTKNNWNSTVDAICSSQEHDSYTWRIDQLRAQAEALPVVGFIGSERGFERLSAYARPVWLHVDRLHAQFDHIDFETIVIEAVPTTGIDAGADGWSLAFSSLDGGLPAQGAALLDRAQAGKVPVHLWFTAGPKTAGLYRAAAGRADRVIVERHAQTDPTDWTMLPDDAVEVRAATEPAACSVASMRNRVRDLMLVPTASDVFQNDPFVDLVNTVTLYQPLFAEFRYGFARTAIRPRLQNRMHALVGKHTRSAERTLLQAASLVLMPSDSIHDSAGLYQIAIDAVASGAIPVFFGLPRDARFDMFDHVTSAVELMERQASYRITWFRERRWRGLYRRIFQTAVWTKEDRAAVLGRDPMPDDFDAPKITAVLATKRPHLLDQALETFRKQSWDNSELVMVFNTGEVPADLPPLRDNERVFALPEAANIGECLNRGIAAAGGRYWVKMDDDDFYDRHYIRETAHYYRSSQADIVGRRSIYFYFLGPDETKAREALVRHTFMVTKGGHISGASLSATTSSDIGEFSVLDRNSADTNWISKNHDLQKVIFSADSTSLIVFRDIDDSSHTWKIGDVAEFSERFETLKSGHLKIRMDIE